MTARLFGFPAAIAHGMWSMARCAAEFAAQRDAMGRCALEVDFRQPVLLPSWLLLESWNGTAGARDFALRDAQGDKIHLSGSLQPLR